MAEDLTGQMIGLWRVLRRATETGSGVRWLCRCDCGKERVIEAKLLRHGLTRSCGCQTGRLNSERFTENLQGRTFGFWTVLERAPVRGRTKHVRWWCRCQCGKIRDVFAGNLTRGLSQSCGACYRRAQSTSGYVSTL